MNTIVTGAGGNPAVRRMSMNVEGETPTKPGAAAGAAKRGTPTTGSRGGTRGTPTRGRAAPASASKRPPPGEEPIRQVPGQPEPPAGQPGGDEGTSEAVAQRELELINAHVPPLRMGTGANGVNAGVGQQGAGGEVQGQGAGERLAEVLPDDEVPAGGEEGKEEIAEELEEHREEEDESHPEFQTREEEQLEQAEVGDEAAPPSEVLDSVQIEGIESVDAEGVARPDVAAQARAHERAGEDDEGVGAIPDEE